MKTNTLIIGQGISGTFLSHWLGKEGIAHLVIDEERPGTPSKSAAGIINPVTGRRIVKTWMIDKLLPFALEAYRQLNTELSISCLTITETIEFFPTAQMRNAFVERIHPAGGKDTTKSENPTATENPTASENPSAIGDGSEYLKLATRESGLPDDPADPRGPAREDAWSDYFRYDLGYGTISPCAIVDLHSLLAAYRKKLRDSGRLLEELFDPSALQIPADHTPIRYKDIEADRIVFCDGAASFENPYFRNLPFAPNKGEALILEIDGLPPENPIFKKGMVLAPWREGLFWVGSSYEWSFTNKQPTDVFRRRTEAALQEWLKLPFRVMDHIASVRPATLERRPFVGFHPQQPRIGIFNGMGTKGCSLAPYFAEQLAAYIGNGQPIPPDVDVRRFEKVLIR
ncbi:MAG: FAD-dependent oxidoreductase [Puia sp.]|nr:FAD-dependent oxidoreductase [Puia sp.]